MWHWRLDSAHELSQVCCVHGVMTIIHVFPNGIIFGMLLKVEPLEKCPLVYEWSYMLEGEVYSDLYLRCPCIVVECILDIRFFPRGCLRNKVCDLFGSPILHPRCNPKRGLGFVADGDCGGVLEEVKFHLAHAFPM